MMRLICVVTGSDDAFGCDYAMLNLTSELTGLACRRIAILKEQKRLEESLVESYFWDTHADYFSPWLTDEEKDAHALSEMLDGLPAVAGEWMEAPSDFSIPDPFRARVECAQMVVREAGIAFVAIPKHTSSYIFTAEIPLPSLEDAAAA
jgi:hypothetical protein